MLRSRYLAEMVGIMLMGEVELNFGAIAIFRASTFALEARAGVPCKCGRVLFKDLG